MLALELVGEGTGVDDVTGLGVGLGVGDACDVEEGVMVGAGEELDGLGVGDVLGVAVGVAGEGDGAGVTDGMTVGTAVGVAIAGRSSRFCASGLTSIGL